MRKHMKLGIYLSGIGCFFAGATGFLFPYLAQPWPQALVLLGLVLVNIGLFALGQSIPVEAR